MDRTLDMEEKWIQVAKDLAQAVSGETSASLSKEEASHLLGRIQEMERAAHVLLLQAVVASASASGVTTQKQQEDEDAVVECVKPPPVIPDQDLVQVVVQVAEIDPEGECIRRRVDALDLGQTAWGCIKFDAGGSNGGYGGHRPSFLQGETVQVIAKALRMYRDAFVEIDMALAPLSAEGMGVFAERVLQDNSTLRVLKLDRSSLGPDGVAFLAGALRHNKESQINTLSLTRVGLDQVSLVRLCKVLQQEACVPKLEILDVGSNPISSLEPLSRLIQDKPSLKELSIAQLMSPLEVDGFGQAVARSNMECLRAEFTESKNLAHELSVAAKSSRLTQLLLGGDKFDENDYDALGAAVAESKSLRILKVRNGNVMNMPSRKGFFAGIGQNTSLEELFLSQARLVDESSAQLADAVASHPTLHKVTATSCNTNKGGCVQNWALALESSTTLCDLEIDTAWDDDALLIVLQALPNSSSLKTFKLKARGNQKLLQAVEARMQGNDNKAEGLIADFCAGNAKKKQLKQEHDEQVAKQGGLRIKEYVTGDLVMVQHSLADGMELPISGRVMCKSADNWYTILRDDGEPTVQCTLKQIRPRAGYGLPVGTIVNAAAAAGGAREYRARVVEALPNDKYKVASFWTTDAEVEAKLVERDRHQLCAVLP